MRRQIGAAAPTLTPSAPGVVQETPGIEAQDPVLVANTDGTATLWTTLVNRTTDTVFITNAWGADEQDPMALLAYPMGEIELSPDVPVSIGGAKDPYRVRTRDRVDGGMTYRLALEFGGGGLVKVGAPPLTIEAQVVPRTASYEGVANNGPNPAITISDGVVVVVPSQEKAYIGGRISNPIGGGLYEKPTAIDARGRSVAWLHQTATGGGYGLALSEPPHLDDGSSKDADYFLAKDVTVGETVMATIRYPSGDVIASFRVVRGNADGTF